VATFIPGVPGFTGENLNYDRESGSVDAGNIQDAIDKLAEFVGYGEMTKVDVVTIRAEHLSNKSVSLSKPPISWEKIRVFPEGGCNQYFYKDFIIENDNELTWAGLGLDGLLELGDRLVIEYFF